MKIVAAIAISLALGIGSRGISSDQMRMSRVGIRLHLAETNAQTKSDSPTSLAQKDLGASTVPCQPIARQSRHLRLGTSLAASAGHKNVCVEYRSTEPVTRFTIVSTPW